jgi:hypothetical protein
MGCGNQPGSLLRVLIGQKNQPTLFASCPMAPFTGTIGLLPPSAIVQDLGQSTQYSFISQDHKRLNECVYGIACSIHMPDNDE